MGDCVDLGRGGDGLAKRQGVVYQPKCSQSPSPACPAPSPHQATPLSHSPCFKELPALRVCVLPAFPHKHNSLPVTFYTRPLYSHSSAPSHSHSHHTQWVPMMEKDREMRNSAMLKATNIIKIPVTEENTKGYSISTAMLRQ